MTTKFFNAFNDAGERTAFQIRETHDHQYVVIWYNQEQFRSHNDLLARDYVENLMRDNGWHLENIVTKDDDFWWALTFDMIDENTVVNRVMHWINGQYIQIGQDETMTRKDAEIQYGYC